MPPNKIILPNHGNYGANKLNAIATKIVELAFAMGGSEGQWYRALQCNYVFPDGRPCYDPLRGSYSVECPVCGGTGAYYDKPQPCPIIIMDSPQQLDRDKMGSVLIDRVSVSIPASVPARFLEVNNNGRIMVLRDKLVVKTVNKKIWSVLYVDSEPQDPFLAGPLYHTINCISHLVFSETDIDNTPKIFYEPNARELIKEINEEYFKNLEIREVLHENLDNEEKILRGDGKIVTPQSLLEDWGN